MKQEKLVWLANNPFVTKRFALFVGRRCRTMTIKDESWIGVATILSSLESTVS